jgi:A/G-specific adenine glycosylase
MNQKPDDELIQNIQKKLLNWFENSSRQFPWRETKDPFKVLLAEKLLQQTSVRRDLIDIYIQLIDSWPTSWHLARADENEIRKLISPLGLHYRAKEIIRMAQDIEERFEGIVPDSLNNLLSIYGIGEYSARAILCFAFEQDVPLVDTNIARIFIRVFGVLDCMPANPARNKKLIELAEILLPKGRSRRFNWALIDHGALICSARRPLCTSCPINRFCDFYDQTVQL